MLKKAIGYTILLSSTKLAFADKPPANLEKFSLFSMQGETPYIGGNVGLADFGFTGHGIQFAGPSATLFGGSGKRYGEEQKLYLGKELNVDVTRSYIYRYENTSLGEVGYGNHTNTYGLGASLIPGYFISPKTMIYGRAGLEGMHNYASTLITTQLGVGLQHSITKNVDARIEYTSFGATNTGTSSSKMSLGLLYKFN